MFLIASLLTRPGCRSCGGSRRVSPQRTARLGAGGYRREPAVLSPKTICQAQGLPPPYRVVDGAELQAFVPRFTDTTTDWESTAAATAWSGLQSGRAPVIH